jgi:peptidoglycan/LPS O-acetylase OafA/YrhL
MRFGNDRSTVLDALRAVAILLVLGRHANVSQNLTRIGWCGVDLFFVISGFLISGLLFKEYKRFGNIHLKRFWLRRGMKIYPAFYFYLLVEIVWYLSIYKQIPGAEPPRLFWFDATFLSNYFEGLTGHAWSLSVEEHFYFVLPVFLLILMKLRPKKTDPFASIPIVFLLIAIGSLWLRMMAKPAFYEDYYSYLYPTHLRMDSLFCGVMTGYLFHYKPQFLARVARWPLLVAGGMLLTPVYFLRIEYWHMYTWGLTCTFLGFACIITWAIHIPFQPGHLLAWPVNQLARIGVYSYSIYLWHWLIFYDLRPYVRFKCITAGIPVAWSNNLETRQWLFCLVSSIVVGIAMAVVIEQPVLRLRDRWFPSRSERNRAISPSLMTLLYQPEVRS